MRSANEAPPVKKKFCLVGGIVLTAALRWRVRAPIAALLCLESRMHVSVLSVEAHWSRGLSRSQDGSSKKERSLRQRPVLPEVNVYASLMAHLPNILVQL